MGTGKSAVGELVSSHLGRRFVDMDAVIEEREGRAIPQIFAEAGEPYFRQLEADLCRELAAGSGLDIWLAGSGVVHLQRASDEHTYSLRAVTWLFPA